MSEPNTLSDHLHEKNDISLREKVIDKQQFHSFEKLNADHTQRAKSREEAFTDAQKIKKTKTGWRQKANQQLASGAKQEMLDALLGGDEDLSALKDKIEQTYTTSKIGFKTSKTTGKGIGKGSRFLGRNVRNGVRWGKEKLTGVEAGKQATTAQATAWTTTGTTTAGTAGAATTTATSAGGAAGTASGGAGTVAGASAGAGAGIGIGALILFLILLLVILISMMSASQSSGNAPTKDPQTIANAEAAYSLLKSKGYTTQAIAGILGNWSIESGINARNYEAMPYAPGSDKWQIGVNNQFNPSRIWGSWGKFTSLYSTVSLNESAYESKYGQTLGIGVGELTGPRGAALIDYAASNKEDIGSLTTQLNFILNADSASNRFYLNTVIKPLTDVKKAADDFYHLWEGGTGASGTNLSGRETAAEQWYLFFTAPPSNGTSAAGKGTGTVYKNIPAGWDVSLPDPTGQTYPGNNYPFSQCTWGAYNYMYQIGNALPWFSGSGGNGGSWGQTAIKYGLKTSSTPQVGWAVSFSPGAYGADPTAGHVAVVVAVHPDGSFLVVETNAVNPGSGTYSYRVIPGASGLTFIHP